MSTQTLTAVFTGVCTGGCVLSVAARGMYRRRSPALRMQVYLETARNHLEGSTSLAPPATPVAGEVLRRVMGPLMGNLASMAGRSLGMTLGDELQLLLRQAGAHVTFETYRREHLRWLMVTPLLLGAVGVVTGSPTCVGLFFLAGLLAGARRMPERLRAQVRRRCESLRNDLPTVMTVLALKIENNKSLPVALGDVVSQGSGPVVDDLVRGLNLMNAGYGDAAAFEHLATESPEPAASRFYRLLSGAMAGGLDVASALLEQAKQLRAHRREEVERTAARRQMALVVPNLIFMAPVMFAFLLAPLPQLLFGH